MSKIRNIFIIFLVSGLWHGANWTFIIWGLLNAIYITPSIIFNTNRNNLDIVAKGKYFPTVKEFLTVAATFCLTVFAWIFFRANNIKHAINYITEIFSRSLFSMPHFPGRGTSALIIFLIIIFIVIEWLGREQQYALQVASSIKKSYLRIICYYIVIVSILMFGNFGGNQFIYFQF